ncbi:MAG: acyl--CoA ligase [Rhodoferax sp.]|nr:acyl--CoA ligase [Rhodoferax sp.]
MKLVPDSRITDFTRRGWWGTTTLDQLFCTHVQQRPDRVAVVDAPNRNTVTDGEPRRLTYAQLDAQVDRLAGVLLADGLRHDDIVVVQLPNCVEQFMAYLACARLGAIVTPVPAQYREHELGHVLTLTGARAAITSRRIGRHAHGQMFMSLRARHPALRTVFAFGDAQTAWPAGVVALEPRMADRYDSDALRTYTATLTLSANDVFTICWTSGTEAIPKGVPRSHNEWLSVAPAAIESANLQPQCRMLCPFPLVNMAGISVGFVAWLKLGGTAVQHHPFDLTVFLQQLRSESIDYTIAAPAVLGQMLHDDALTDGIDFQRLCTIGSGSAPLSPWLVEGFKNRFGVDIVNHFGSNEGASLTSGPRDIPAAADRARYFPRAGVQGIEWSVSTTRRIETRLVDLETDAEITEPGRTGELRYRGVTVFHGYWNAPDKTAQAFDAQGYFRTGDLFEIAGPRNEFYRYVGRSKDLIIRGGMNISPEELENLILAHPSVREAAVVGYPDSLMGERVCACVVLHADAALELQQLAAFLRDQQRVAAFKLPERLEVLEALPRNPVGKVLKRMLREQLAAGRLPPRPSRKTPAATV